MNENKPVAHAAPVEMLTEWEGPAVHEPGVLFEERQGEHLVGETEVAAVAGWVGATVLSALVGNVAYDALKKKVLGFLSGWRQRHGQAKLDEVKQELFLRMQKHRKNPKVTDAELRERIDLL